MDTFRLKKNDDDRIYDTPDTKTAPPLPPRIGQNVSYGISPQKDLYMTINTAYDTNEQSVAYGVSPQHISKYMFVERISPEDTSGTVRTNSSLTMDLTSVTETGLYLALVDLSTCITVHRLLVFYYVCPAETSNLITRPETIAPESAIPGQCAENSSPTSSDQPLVSCTVMGTWDTIIGCACDPGFQGVTESGTVASCSGIYTRT